MKPLALLIYIPTTIIGILLWTGAIGFHDNFLSLFGFILFVLAFFMSISILLAKEDYKVWGFVNGFIFAAMVFTAFLYFGLVPYLKLNANGKNVFGLMTLTLLGIGIISTVIEIVFIIKKKRP